MAPLKVPASSTTVDVSIVNTGSWAYGYPCANFFYPPFRGLDTLDVCSYSFLVTHRNGNTKRRVIFDLGIRKDWENLVPRTVKKIKEANARMEMKKDVADVLSDHGSDLTSIEAVIWSHLHWDHTGNPAKFPESVKLIVGPGVIQKSMPGFPKVASAEFNEADVAGRELLEIGSEQFVIDIGGMPAYDYFGDGSFYLLSAPGHAIGHLNALARTSTEPESYIFMAADSVHLGGEFRPSELLPMPETINEPGLVPCPCSRDLLLDMHPDKSATTPFMGPSNDFPDNVVAAKKTIEQVQVFDADDRFLVVFAHDTTLFDTLEFYPKLANEWRKKGWKGPVGGSSSSTCNSWQSKDLRTRQSIDLGQQLGWRNAWGSA